MAFHPLEYFRTLNVRPPSLTQGDQGWYVEMLHRLLDWHGELVLEKASFDDGKIEARPRDTFDWQFEDAVKRFQLKRGMVVDGVVGPVTWSHLVIANQYDAGQLALRVALQEAYGGAREVGGNNRGPFVYKYTNGREGPQWAWCVAFATWCHIQANHTLTCSRILKERFSSSRLWKEAERWKLRTTTPRIGDYVLVKGGPTKHKHTALYSHMVGNTVYVVEGNVRPRKWMSLQCDTVRQGSYKRSQVDFVRAAIKETL